MGYHIGTMTDREAKLQRLADGLTEYEAVEDAWVAKRFTDRHLVVDLQPDIPFPDGLRDELVDHGLHGSNGVYGIDEDDGSFAGFVGRGNRHHFVDVQTRGDHQSYVVD